MKRLVATTLCVNHMLTFAVCTYIAAVDIETILVTGWIGSATGLVAGTASLVAREWALAMVSFLAPMVAVVLTVLEIHVLQLGPDSAARPFCIVFILVQAVTNFVSFRSFRFGADFKQISIRTLLLATVACAVFFSVVRQLLKREHDAIMLIALSMAGLTFVGVFLTVYKFISCRFPNKLRGDVVS